MTSFDATNQFGLRFHHLGLAVDDPEVAILFLSGLGYRTGDTFFDPLQNVHLLMCVHASMPAVEIIYPAQGAGPLDKLLAKHKKGLIYHMCYSTDDLDASIKSMETDERIRLICISPPKRAVLFGGKEVSFYLVAGVGLIEIINEKAAGPISTGE